MFTIKLYAESGYRQRILEAESFTILRGYDGGTTATGAEITLHRNPGPDGEDRDVRYDVGYSNQVRSLEMPDLYQRAIIENASGKTTEIISFGSIDDKPSRLAA